MNRAVTVIIAFVLMAIPFGAMAHIETKAEYDQRLEREIAEAKNELPYSLGDGDDSDGSFDLRITSIEKKGEVIITTIETKGENGWIAMAESMGGVENFKAFEQIRMAEDALMNNNLQLTRGYTLRNRYIDNGKEVCTVDISATIIVFMMKLNIDVDQPKYTPRPLTTEESRKSSEYEKYSKEGGYPPAMTEEERHRIIEFKKYWNGKILWFPDQMPFR